MNAAGDTEESVPVEYRQVRTRKNPLISGGVKQGGIKSTKISRF